MKIIKIIFGLILLCTYATARTAKQVREFPLQALRLSQAEYPSYNIIAPDGPGTYAFGYEIDDPATGNVQFKDEEKLRNGTVRGSYGWLQPDGTLFITRYVADQFGYRAKTETRRQATGPYFQPQSPIPMHTTSRPQSVVSIPNNAVQIISSTTPTPPPYPTQPSTIDPNIANALLQQHQINSNPSYNPVNDENVLSPQLANAILSGQQIVPNNRQPGFLSLRQRQGTQNMNQQPFFGNWFGNNNNNNQLNQQSDSTSQTGPILSWLGQFPNAVSNLVQNNPISNFISNWQNNNQNQNSPFQNFVTNAQTGISQINPFPNLFQGNNNNNNNPSSVLTSLSQGFQQALPSNLQSDYIPPTGSQALYPQQMQYMSTPFSVQNNIDSAMFMTNKYPMQHNPNSPIDLNSNYYTQQLQNNYNPYPMQSLNQLDMNSNYYPHMGNQYTAMNSHIITNPTAGMFPYQYQYPMNTPRPYKSGNYVNTRIQTTKNGLNRKTTRRKQSNRNKVKAVNSGTTESAWFEDFLDKRRQMNTNTVQSKEAKEEKSSDKSKSS